MAEIHLMVGFMGFGKTTLARKLEKELPAVRLTHDEFMRKLFSRNLPEADFRLAWQKVDDLIWELAAQIVRSGTNVILDYGFWSRDSRRQAFEKASRLTEKIIFHQVCCDARVAKQRVLHRSKTDPDELFIDEHCFDNYWAQYEPLDEAEGYLVVYEK